MRGRRATGMLGPVTESMLAVIETYYDAAPRPTATTEELGPFTLFLRTEPGSWPYYARPRLGLATELTADDVRRVRKRQRELGVPETFEWVHQTTPSLLTAADEAGLAVQECPLLALEDPLPGEEPSMSAHRRVAQDVTPRVELVGPDDDALPLVVGAIHASFGDSDMVEPGRTGARPRLIDAGLLSIVAAYDEQGDVVGGGSHSPRGDTTELTGIAVIPRARRRGIGEAVTAALVADARSRGTSTVFLSAQDDAVARVYEQVGFVRVGTACMARMTEPS